MSRIYRIYWKLFSRIVKKEIFLNLVELLKMFESVLLLGPLGLEHGLLHAWSIPELLKVFVHHHLDLVHVLLCILLHLQLPSLLTLVDLRHHLLLLLVLKVFLGVFLHFRNIRKRHRDNINKEVVDIVNVVSLVLDAGGRLLLEEQDLGRMKLFLVDLLVKVFVSLVLLSAHLFSKIAFEVLLQNQIDIIVVLDVHLHLVEDVPVAHCLVVHICDGGNGCLPLHKLRQVVVLNVTKCAHQVFGAAAAEVVQVGLDLKQLTVKHHQAH